MRLAVKPGLWIFLQGGGQVGLRKPQEDSGIFISQTGGTWATSSLFLCLPPPDSLYTHSGAEVAESIRKTETKTGVGLISSSLLFQPFRNLAHHRYWVPSKPIGKQAQAMGLWPCPTGVAERESKPMPAIPVHINSRCQVLCSIDYYKHERPPGSLLILDLKSTYASNPGLIRSAALRNDIARLRIRCRP